MANGQWLNTVIALCFIPLLEGCVESSFDLADEARLPKWFAAPKGLARSDLRVTLDYHTDGSAVFKMYRKSVYFSIDKVTGQASLADQSTVDKYPLYVIVSTGGGKEVIEHRAMEPVFYVVNDPLVLKELQINHPQN